MLKQVKNDIINSFVLWADHILCEKGRAFTNWSGYFYNGRNSKMPSVLSTYNAPFREFVYDQSVSGAVIPSGVYVNNVFIARGTSGVKIDYVNGRVWFSGAANTNLSNVSGNYAVKEYNVYLTSKSEEQLIYETAYAFKPPYLQQSTGLSINQLVAPCIFVINPDSQNKAENLGGETYQKCINMRAVVLAASDEDLYNVGGFFEDRAFSNYAILDSTPLDYYGDFKTGGYSYTTQVAGRPLAYIQNVYFTKFDPDAENSLSNQLKVGFLEFEIEYSTTRDRGI